MNHVQSSCQEYGMKVLVIGLDGADFDLVTSMVAAGKLPNIGRIMEQGVYGPLTSVLPPISAPAWASFMTGNDPGTHGVFAFFEHTPGLMDIDSLPLVTADSIRSPKLWDILKKKGKKTHVVNVPVTYPPSKVNGVMIPSFDAPSGASDFFHPPRIQREIEELLGHPYVADCQPDQHFSGESLNEWADAYFRIEEDRAKVVIDLMNRYPWDFFMVVFSLTDRVGHLCWQNVELIQKTYEKADALVGRVMQALREETTVIVLSDHGFGDLKSYFVTNKWLHDQGFLQLKSLSLSNFCRSYHIRPTDISIGRVMRRLRWRSRLSCLPKRLRDKHFTVPLLRRNAADMVDWSKTKAYGASYGICVNLRGREPQGIVDSGAEYEMLREDIIDRLKSLKDPQGGKELVTSAKKREDVYSGPFVHRAPDVIFWLNHLSHVQVNYMKMKKTFVKPTLSGTHRLNGIFLAKGKGLKRGFSVNGARIIDVAPTILYAMGLPILENISGKLLEQCFEQSCLQERPAVFEDSQMETVQMIDSRLLDKEETEEIAQRLRYLGYLE